MGGQVFARADKNQPEIVKYLRAHGWHVTHIFTVGKGVPDLIASKAGLAVLLEVKDGTLEPSHQRLNDAEVKFFREFQGIVHKVITPQEALEKCEAHLTMTDDQRRELMEFRRAQLVKLLPPEEPKPPRKKRKPHKPDIDLSLPW